jgi:hypothetical protein
MAQSSPDLGGFFLAPARSLHAAFDKFGFLLGHFFRDFFAHGFAEFVDFFPRISGQVVGNGQQVILVNQNP